ncbi:predicted protein [Pyrenophora tritici-repentis Pt-1C-BFP]|uniref:Uncharacterized protein n=1 Tax=Pyrenophora tritici-repentis (strain Pt-1C-BFP) TaxID=426418 RepID=B2WBN9_PYRTR|nr:uncharacterized protein PTRG_07052 [Pyrenophora tritici-repentis Pt-1C-BFP]EDU49971.1 predicted protein [Pyrenophora tritici-repentis Pt-1C-BFP]
MSMTVPRISWGCRYAEHLSMQHDGLCQCQERLASACYGLFATLSGDNAPFAFLLSRLGLNPEPLAPGYAPSHVRLVSA